MYQQTTGGKQASTTESESRRHHCGASAASVRNREHIQQRAAAMCCCGLVGRHLTRYNRWAAHHVRTMNDVSFQIHTYGLVSIIMMIARHRNSAAARGRSFLGNKLAVSAGGAELPLSTIFKIVRYASDPIKARVVMFPPLLLQTLWLEAADSGAAGGRTQHSRHLIQHLSVRLLYSGHVLLLVAGGGSRSRRDGTGQLTTAAR